MCSNPNIANPSSTHHILHYLVSPPCGWWPPPLWQEGRGMLGGDTSYHVSQWDSRCWSHGCHNTRAVLIPPPFPFIIIIIIIIILRFTQMTVFYRLFCTTTAQQKTSFGLRQRRSTGPGKDHHWITLPVYFPQMTPRATTVRSSYTSTSGQAFRPLIS